MEFHEKLQTLRKSKGLTQEQLAEALFVSRAAISKWETGKGYPSIDSLRDISTFFSVSLDELICSEDAINLAEKDKKDSISEYSAVICSSLDILVIILLFIPVFRIADTAAFSASVFGLTEILLWQKYLFITIISLTSLNGLRVLLFHNKRYDHSSRSILVGMILSIIGSMAFILSRQPYAALIFFTFLVVKGFLLFKAK